MDKVNDVNDVNDVKVEKVDSSNVKNVYKSRERSYSHLNRRPDSLDSVVVDGVTYVIPATIGTNYWAILKVMYHHINSPVLFDELTEEVETLMKEHDEDNWNHFVSKKQTTVYKKSIQQREIKNIKSWEDRVVANAKTLCRWKDYGKRLYEIGHIMVMEYDKVAGEPYFILYDNHSVLNKASKNEE